MMLFHHLLLVVSAGLLLGAGGRIAQRLSPDPLSRLVAAAAIAATAAVAEALALGLVALGTNPAALTAAAAVTYIVARSLVAPAREALCPGLHAAWSRLSPGMRLGLGALVGACLAWTVWLLRNPVYDWDNLAYHIPEIVAWVHNGQPGSIVLVVPGTAYGNLPVTNEVLLSWGSGIARSFAWITIWPGLVVTLLAASGWLGLRAMRIPAVTAGLASASLCAAPMLTSYQGNGANSDLPAVVWLVVAASLCAAASREGSDGLLAPALLAAGLSLGTKTTTAPYVLAVLAVIVYRARARLRGLRTPLALACVAAVVVGGTWYIRNLLQHGTPFWPYFSTPWGDPLPKLPNSTFFNHPLASLKRAGDPGYVTDTFLGSLLVLGACVIAGVLARRRALAACAALTVMGVFLWTFAPSTGAPPASLPAADAFHGAVRYLMPAAATATFGVALAARHSGPRLVHLWNAVLAAALTLNVVQLFGLGYPKVPGVLTPILGAVVGAPVAVVLGAVLVRGILRLALAGVGIVAIAAGLAGEASGFTARHERANFADVHLIPWFAGPGNDGRKIYTAPVELVMLSKDNLSRRVEAIPRLEPCQKIEARLRKAWLVVEKLDTEPLLGPSTTGACVARWRPVFEDSSNVVYDSRSLPRGPS